MTSKDVVIVGGGAAGATAAFHLARAGKKVTLLEKSSSKGLKPCGGGMAAAVQAWFPFDLTQVVDEVIDRVDFTWCLEDLVVADLPGSSPFWIVRREEFDHLLTTYAVNAGAELLNPFQVVTLKKVQNLWQVTSCDGRQLEAKAVVIANGSSSSWPKQLNLGPRNQHHATTTSVRLKGRGNLQPGTTRFEFGLVRHGFAWAFPITEGVNIGIGSFLGDNSDSSDAVLNQLLPSLGFAPTDGTRQQSLLRVWNGHHNLHGDGVIVIGDAASLCDPFLAEGLRPALLSGFEGARSIIHWLDNETNDLKNYTQAMKSKWGESMAWGRRIAQVFYRFPKIGYELGIKRPTAPQRIAQILSGEMGYGDIAQRVIKRLLFQRN